MCMYPRWCFSSQFNNWIEVQKDGVLALAYYVDISLSLFAPRSQLQGTISTARGTLAPSLNPLFWPKTSLRR